MPKTATITLDGKTIECPVIVGSEGEMGIDVTQLRAKTGAVTIDQGFMNTASCESRITYIDGEKGILRYRGYTIEELCAHSTFTEVAYLLIYGELPTRSQYEKFTFDLTHHTMIHEDLRKFYDAFPHTAHPMALLSAMVCSLSTFYQDSIDPLNPEHARLSILRLLAKIPTIAAYTYKKSIGQPFVYPDNSLRYSSNFMKMMFSVPAEPYVVDPDVDRAMNQLLILHADHEQNCSTSTVRLVGSSQANLFASAAAGICALWGPLHGGANQEVLEMLERIHADGGDVKKYVEMAKSKTSNFKLMGFGHRVYKNYDPRATIIKGSCDKILSKLGIKDPLLDIAKQLEDAALNDSYFIERKLFPNVDFYSGIIYRAIGFPTDMFTVLFAIGRTPGWIAQWKEMMESPANKIGRPRQIYQGEQKRAFVPIEQRS
ncbi:MAG: citrate synthase [Planctomycetota bacterium]